MTTPPMTQHYPPQPFNYGPPPQQQYPPRPPAQPKVTAVWALGLVSVAAVLIGLSIDEDGTNAWSRVNSWGGLAIAASVLTLAPAFGRSFGLTAQRAWQVGAAGAAGLVLFWVLFTLPYVGSNTSLVTTIGVGAGALAVWLAPGRER